MVGQTGGCPPPVCTGHHSLEAPCRSQVLCWSRSAASFLQLSATDASVRTTMKGAAKCDEHCKLQNSANQQNFERILRFRDMPESMPTSESHWLHALGLTPSVLLRISVCCNRCCAESFGVLRARDTLSDPAQLPLDPNYAAATLDAAFSHQT